MTSRDEAEARKLGRRIRQLRERLSLRQDDVAALIETDAGSVSRIENGKRDPSLRQLRRLARRFGMSPGQLLDGTAPSGSAPRTRTASPARSPRRHEESFSQPTV